MVEPASHPREARQSFTLDADNTFSFLPGPMLGVSCPACFRNQLLKEVVTTGTCTQCGAALELTLTADVDSGSKAGD